MKIATTNYPVIYSLLATLLEAGFELNKIHFRDGGRAKPKSIEAASKEVAESYASELEFRPVGKPDENPFFAVIYTDNYPGEVVNDHTTRDTEYGKEFDKAIEGWQEKWDKRQSPAVGCPLYALAFDVLKFQNHVHPHVVKKAKEALVLP